MIMNFCKKSVQSLLGNFSNSNDYGTLVDRSIQSPVKSSGEGDGLTLISLSGEIKRPIHVVESAAVKPPGKRDPGGIGFLDDVGGSVNGLMSCTESLGFESSDERRVDDVENFPRPLVSKSRRALHSKREVKKFPPPLSSLNHNGHPTFYLKPVRKDGRLELREVKIHRPETLRASRQDGRLTLHFIHREEDPSSIDDVEQQQQQDKFVEQEQEEMDEKSDERWQFLGTDGFRRCNEVNHHHTHNLHVWSQHCVTIR